MFVYCNDKQWWFKVIVVVGVVVSKFISYVLTRNFTDRQHCRARGYDKRRAKTETSPSRERVVDWNSARTCALAPAAGDSLNRIRLVYYCAPAFTTKLLLLLINLQRLESPWLLRRQRVIFVPRKFGFHFDE